MIFLINIFILHIKKFGNNISLIKFEIILIKYYKINSKFNFNKKKTSIQIIASDK